MNFEGNVILGIFKVNTVNIVRESSVAVVPGKIRITSSHLHEICKKCA